MKHSSIYVSADRSIRTLSDPRCAGKYLGIFGHCTIEISLPSIPKIFGSKLAEHPHTPERFRGAVIEDLVLERLMAPDGANRKGTGVDRLSEA
jgi:hypothetical protein